MKLTGEAVRTIPDEFAEGPLGLHHHRTRPTATAHNSLVEYFTGHRAGSFDLRHEIPPVSAGFEFLGYHIRRDRDGRHVRLSISATYCRYLSKSCWSSNATQNPSAACSGKSFKTRVLDMTACCRFWEKHHHTSWLFFRHLRPVYYVVRRSCKFADFKWWHSDAIRERRSIAIPTATRRRMAACRRR